MQSQTFLPFALSFWLIGAPVMAEVQSASEIGLSVDMPTHWTRDPVNEKSSMMLVTAGRNAMCGLGKGASLQRDPINEQEAVNETLQFIQAEAKIRPGTQIVTAEPRKFGGRAAAFVQIERPLQTGNSSAAQVFVSYFFLAGRDQWMFMCSVLGATPAAARATYQQQAAHIEAIIESATFADQIKR